MAFKTSLLFLQFLIKAQIICFAKNPLRQIFTHVSIVIFVVSFWMLTAIVICFLQYMSSYILSPIVIILRLLMEPKVLLFLYFIFFIHMYCTPFLLQY